MVAARKSTKHLDKYEVVFCDFSVVMDVSGWSGGKDLLIGFTKEGEVSMLLDEPATFRIVGAWVGILFQCAPDDELNESQFSLCSSS